MCAQARKALKEAHKKLQEEVAAHKCTSEALNQHINTEAHVERKILEIRADAKKQQQWFEDQLAGRAEVAKQLEQILKDQNYNMEGTHTQEAQL